MRLKKRLLALALAVLLVLPGVLLSPALPAAAQTTSDLYGTGSADEINIVKLLDMALNKGGMSMSPATIKAFLEFWWTSVSNDLSTCISNADSAITTTQAFADYVISALENADHYDKLGSIVQQYVRFVLTLDAKSVSDFKQLLTQQGTFRRFLLSYVTDQDGNTVSSIAKTQKYNIGKSFVNMTRKAAEAYIEEYEGYWIIPTLTYKDMTASSFSSKDTFDESVALLKTLPNDFICLFSGGNTQCFAPANDLVIVGSFYDASSFFSVSFYHNDWTNCYVNGLYLKNIGDRDLSTPFDSSNVAYHIADLYTSYNFIVSSFYPNRIVLFTTDGRTVKIWKSLDAFKASSIGQSNIYYTNAYSSYDASVDNSIEFSGSYYNSSNTTYSHDVIQNSIDNSSEINESTVNNITNQTINNITNNYGDSSGSGSGSSGSGGWWNVGDGIEAFIQGVAELLDFALKLLGDLVGLLGRFLTDVLEVFKSLGVVGSGFGEFLKEVFGFLPDECISLIMSSIGAMCIVGVVKAFKK